MSKSSLPRPTEAELELLRVLWQRGPSTVREIHEAVSGAKDTGYTTTLKILQRMAEKGLVVRDESNRSHVYRAAREAEQTQRQLVRDLLQRAFGGAPGKLVVQILSEQRATAEELAEIRRMLDELDANIPLKKGTVPLGDSRKIEENRPSERDSPLFQRAVRRPKRGKK